MLKSLKKFLWIVFLLLFLGAFFHGIKIGDLEQTKVNGSALCLSCIGIE